VRKTGRSRNILYPGARLRNRRYETITSPLQSRDVSCTVLSITKRLTEPAASALLTFSHRIQRAKASAIGHVRCAQLSQHHCHPRRAGRALLVGSANRMNPNAVGLDPESSFRKGCLVTMVPIPAVALTPVAYFPENYFLEDLVVRADSSVLVTTALQNELWYVPSAKPGTAVSPVLLHTFKHPILGIVEAELDVIIISVCDLCHTHESQLARIDFKGWSPVYYTSTAQKVFTRISVSKASLDPVGDPEFVAGIDNCDDFCIDEHGGFAYISRHRANTRNRVPLQPGRGGEVRHIVDDPSDRVMVGPTSAAWRRGPDDYGRVFYLLTDGGRTVWPSPDGIIRRPALVRAELHSVPKV